MSLAISSRVGEVCAVFLLDTCHVLLLGFSSKPGDADVKCLRGAMLVKNGWFGQQVIWT